MKISNFMVDSYTRVYRKIAMSVRNRSYRCLKGEYSGGVNIWKRSYKKIVSRRL